MEIYKPDPIKPRKQWKVFITIVCGVLLITVLCVFNEWSIKESEEKQIKEAAKTSIGISSDMVERVRKRHCCGGYAYYRVAGKNVQHGAILYSASSTATWTSKQKYWNGAEWVEMK